MKEIVLIKVSGHDRPGITAQLTTVLGRFGVNVLDIGQAVIHNELSWGMLVEIPPGPASTPVFKELLFTAHELDLDVRITPVSESDYSNWVGEQGQARHVITVLGRQIKAEHLSRVAELITVNRLNIDKIVRLSGRALLSTPEYQRQAAIEFSVRGTVTDMSVMRATFLHLSQVMDVDVAIQSDDAFRRNRRLVCFDMDSTLIRNEVIDELAKVHGVAEQVQSITASAMRGEIDFGESFRARVALLAGLEESALAGVADSLVVTGGTERLLAILRHFRFRTAILSGGFTFFARYLQQRLGVDIIHANELEIVDGRVTGRVTGPIVDEQAKAILLERIAKAEGIRLEQVIAVGDGANDLPMLSRAGLGIAFRAKPIVRQKADYHLRSTGLDAILYLIGMRDRDFEEVACSGSVPDA
ncbi:MAG: phosphoserine phosphatase SerB [Acidiferrobacteraceae bacterium]|jgi:phosphoserine phosphatase|nr:phosphoserine phosphatase SerB [Acidiferrobacteraceae bacterium]MCP4828751.1 phosphoserine phosphatase SerB [Pseudomonadota bacterium]HJP06084.1 phosphoserine phosphatase SerB [Arenicellales bacterium]|tara:strand:- start:15224 stop:16468 length:1245 start_codon:yes stop_codon:yes gene_type:complete